VRRARGARRIDPIRLDMQGPQEMGGCPGDGGLPWQVWVAQTAGVMLAGDV